MSKDVQEQPPRLTIRLTEEQRKYLSDLIPWGLQDKIFGALIDDLITVMLKASRAGQLKLLAQALISRSLMLSEVGDNWKEIQKDAGLLEDGLQQTKNTLSDTDE